MRGIGRQKLGSMFSAITYGCALACGIPILLLTDIGIIGKYVKFDKSIKIIT